LKTLLLFTNKAYTHTEPKHLIELPTVCMFTDFTVLYLLLNFWNSE